MLLLLQVTFALVELFKVEETGEQVQKFYHRLFAACLVRLGSSVGVSPPKTVVRLAFVFHVYFTFHLSPRLCASSAGCSPPSVSSIVFCLLLSCSRWFPPSLLCCLAIFCLVVLLISSLSLVATLCSVWSTCCPSFLLYVWPISTVYNLLISTIRVKWRQIFLWCLLLWKTNIHLIWFDLIWWWSVSKCLCPVFRLKRKKSPKTERRVLWRKPRSLPSRELCSSSSSSSYARWRCLLPSRRWLSSRAPTGFHRACPSVVWVQATCPTSKHHVVDSAAVDVYHCCDFFCHHLTSCSGQCFSRCSSLLWYLFATI